MQQKIQAIETRKQSGSGLLITLLIAGLLIAFIYLAADYVKQQRVQEGLRQQIAQKNNELAALPASSPDLQQRLEKAQNANLEMKAALSAETVSSTRIMTQLLDTAESCGLQSSNLNTEKWSSRTIGDSLYRLMPVNLDLKGTAAGLVSFLAELEKNPAFLSLVIENFTLDSPQGTGTPDTVTQLSARLNAMIVTRPETIAKEQ